MDGWGSFLGGHHHWIKMPSGWDNLSIRSSSLVDCRGWGWRQLIPGIVHGQVQQSVRALARTQRAGKPPWNAHPKPQEIPAICHPYKVLHLNCRLEAEEFLFLWGMTPNTESMFLTKHCVIKNRPLHPDPSELLAWCFCSSWQGMRKVLKKTCNLSWLRSFHASQCEGGQEKPRGQCINSLFDDWLGRSPGPDFSHPACHSTPQA